ncbi:MAG: cysteine desulfurase [Planctomycetota bacterium]|jgi:cysteine desulfurase
MLPLLQEHFHNPSSPYPAAEAVADQVGIARGRVARLIGARRPSEIVFTSGGSESIHAAFYGAREHLAKQPRVVTSSVEHSAVKAAVARAAASPMQHSCIQVDSSGILDRSALFAAIEDGCGLVSLMLANNETGVLTDLEGIGAACRSAGALFHVDLVQGPGKLPLSVEDIGCDLASIAGHKFHGPKGIGALFVRHGVQTQAWLTGGPQEHERRAGTENTPAIVGMGVAAEIATGRAKDPAALLRLRQLRDDFESELLAALPDTMINGGEAARVPNTSNLHFPGSDASLLLALLADAGIQASAGSACNADSRAPSPVLLAMGLNPEQALASLRFSLSHETTRDEIQLALTSLVEASRTLAGLR